MKESVRVECADGHPQERGHHHGVAGGRGAPNKHDPNYRACADQQRRERSITITWRFKQHNLSKLFVFKWTCKAIDDPVDAILKDYVLQLK